MIDYEWQLHDLCKKYKDALEYKQIDILRLEKLHFMIELNKNPEILDYNEQDGF